MEPVTFFWIVGILVAGLVGWALGSRPGREDRVEDVLQGLAAELRAGRRPALGPDQPDSMTDVREALDRNWATREEERERALKEALGRIAAFLRGEVAGPLSRVQGNDPEVLRDAMERAVGSLRDLEFFLREPLEPDETHNLVPVVQKAAREFTQDWEIGVRVMVEKPTVRAHIHETGFMDALYLLLHNAGQFGEGETIDVIVATDDGGASVTVRDRGPGFTDEALERAHDLFFSTTEGGLGLGIPFARRTVESFGGDLEIRNRPEGGAEVELSLPAA